jgi:hypothetical protein
MDNKHVELIASNLTIAFYTGSIQREPWLKKDKRKTLYSPNQKNRIGTISFAEVEHVFSSFCDAVRSRNPE